MKRLDDDEQRYPAWMERDPITDEMPEDHDPFDTWAEARGER